MLNPPSGTYLRLCLQVLIAVLLTGTAWAGDGQTAVGVGPERPVVELAGQAEYLLDPAGTLRYEEIARGSLPFVRHARDSFQFSFQRAALWIRCPIAPAEPGGEAPLITRRSFLAFDNAALGSVTLWVPVVREGQSDTVKLSGGWQAGGEKDEFPFLYPLFALPEQIDPARPVIIRVATPYALQFRATLYSLDAFRESSFILFLIIGFCSGILVAMLLYNLVLYLYMRDRHYIYYILYVFFLLAWQCVLFGLVSYFWPTLGEHLMAWSVLFAILMMVFAVVFAIVFLDTARTAPRHDRLLKGLAAFMGAIVLLIVLRQLWLANLMAYLAGQAGTVLLFTSALSSLRSGFRPALYYLVAVGVFLSTAVIFLCRFYGLLPNNSFTMHIVIFGSAAEAILLSFALGYRFRLMREEEALLRAREKSLEAISVKDELTGLFNRRFFNASLVKKVAAARRSDTPLSLLMMDVDRFKLFNDTYGHPEGDRVLSALGVLATASLREEDIACRYGGEEFVVILHNADRPAAQEVAERIRAECENRAVQPGKRQAVHVTVSIGIAQLEPGETAEDFLLRADQALYRAKQAGRNRICCGEAPLPPEPPAHPV